MCFIKILFSALFLINLSACSALPDGAPINTVVTNAQSISPWQKLKYINNTVNLQAKNVLDISNYGLEDYWATPSELWTVKKADCEDYATTKYFLLELAGINPDLLFLSHVTVIEENQAHMVLLYFQKDENTYYVLDNLTPDILPLQSRPDLSIVYSFNRDDMWMNKQTDIRGEKVGSTEQMELWKNLKQRWSQEKHTVK
jgi:predicted transglutaminase-like cysteine proteinase